MELDSQLKIKQEKQTKRTLVFIAVIIGTFMSAIEGTIVSTAMPSIVSDLGGFKLYSWVFSIYLLMQAVTIPIYGKLADLFGRKPVYTVGVIIFLIGSVFCGFANSMSELIFYRFLQGLGAGAVQPIATTIVGDIYTLKERAKVQGYLASVWGISSIVGPTLGGIFVDYFHWSLVFWINIPFGIVSIILMMLFLHEGIEKKKHSIDYLGSSLLFLSITAIMLAFIQGGVAWDWFSLPSIFLILFFLICITLFLLQEKRAKDPMMPLDLWKNKIITSSNLGALTTGMVMISVASFVPTYVQGVMGYSALIAGLSLGVMSIGWPISSTIAGKLLIKIGSLKTAFIGAIALIIGSIILLFSTPTLGPVWVGFGTFFIGVGMGFTTTTFIFSIQSSVEWKVRGVATASNMFMRILGNTVGVSLMGGLLNNRLARFIEDHRETLGDVDLNITNTMLNPEKRDKIQENVLTLLEEGLNISIHYVFAAVAILSFISFIIIRLLPKKLNR